MKVFRKSFREADKKKEKMSVLRLGAKMFLKSSLGSQKFLGTWKWC